MNKDEKIVRIVVCFFILFIMGLFGLVICADTKTLQKWFPESTYEYVSPGVRLVTIEGHQYIKTDNTMTHSESCPCKNYHPTIITNIIQTNIFKELE